MQLRNPQSSRVQLARILLRPLFPLELVKLRCRDLHPDNTHDYTDANAPWIKAAEVGALEFFKASGR